MSLDELREEVVAVTRRACEGLEDGALAQRVQAAREACASDSDDPLAPARGIFNGLLISGLLIAAGVIAVLALSGCGVGGADDQAMPAPPALNVDPACSVPGASKSDPAKPDDKCAPPPKMGG